MARRKRQKTFPVNENYLPPRLRLAPSSSDFAPVGSLARELPITLYWGKERNVDLDGLRPPGVPGWLGRFDWVIGFEYGWANIDSYPSSVFCEPQYLPELLSYIERRWLRPESVHSILAIPSGPDFLLSWQRPRHLEKLRRYFSCIYYEAKDVEFPGVGVLPTGLMEHYTRANADHVLSLARSLDRIEKSATSGLSVLAAWGAWWPGLDDLVPDRKRAREFAASSPIVTAEQFSSDRWFGALTHYDFMLSPLGNGIQAPKTVEAILMGCIPVATTHPTLVDLERRGMPILILDSWTDLNKDIIAEAYPMLFAKMMAFREVVLDLDRWWRFSFPCHDHEPAGFPT